jgi:hypothetical protein
MKLATTGACLAAFAILMIVATGGCSQAMTASELLDSCRQMPTPISSETKAADLPVPALACWNYMQAVRDLASLTYENGTRLLRACPPRQGTTGDLVQLYLKYVSSGSGELRQRAAIVVVLEALWKAYPCSG